VSDPPLVSVIVPCRDETELTSVFRWPDWAEMLFQFEEGIGNARNAGAKRAKADRLVFMDADLKLSGDLTSVLLIRDDEDVAYTANGYLYSGDDLYTQLSVFALRLVQFAAEAPEAVSPLKLPRLTHGLMACHRNFFHEFDLDKLEDVRWGPKFKAVVPLPIRIEFTRPLTNPLEWRRRRGEPI
jgi:hypothetical protein